MNNATSQASLDRQQPQASHPNRRELGVTLVEMLVVVAITAILTGMAAPSLRATMDSVKLSSASNLLLSGFHLARSEAIKRNSRVVVCKSSDGESCASTGGWEQGWIVFHDANNNSVRDAQEVVVRREQHLAMSLRLTGNQAVSRYVSFAPTGGTKVTGGSFQAGTLTLCHEDGGEARQIILNAVGRPRVFKTALASCPG